MEGTQAARPLALVTGASSGIGRAYARRLAADGYDLILVGRDRERLEAAAVGTDAAVRVVVADLATDAGVAAVAAMCRDEPLTLLVNNAGVAHYMAFTQLPADQASELLHVKVVAPTLLAHAAAPGMVARGGGTIVNVAGMLAFGAGAPLGPAAGRATYVATLSHLVALTRALHVELSPLGVTLQVVCPGLVATEFHTRQGMDLSALPRMGADEVVTASLRGLALGEVLCAPGVERTDLLDATLDTDLAAFAAQSPRLAERYTG